MTLVRPALVADLYGPAHYASIAGVVAFAATMAQPGSPPGAGAAYGTLGHSDPSLCTLARQTGPLVIEVPKESLCVVDDFWFRYLADMSIAGPDHGAGGKYV